MNKKIKSANNAQNNNLCTSLKEFVDVSLLSYWQDILCLNDWHIVLKKDCSPLDMQLKGVAGETEWEEVNKCAVIRIISKKDYGDRILPYNFEQILVHELLHLKFCLLGESGNDLQDRLIHQMIEDISKSLIRVKDGINGNNGQ